MMIRSRVEVSCFKDHLVAYGHHTNFIQVASESEDSYSTKAYADDVLEDASLAFSSL